jgi:multidrug efflux pump
MGGIVGRLFREFSVTLSIAIVVSAVVSLTLTPTMSSRLLRRFSDDKPTRFARVSERGFTALQGLYARCLDWILRHQVAALALTVGTVAFTVFLYVVVPKGLFPQQDTGMLMGSTEASQDVSFPAMKVYQEQVNAIVSADPDVDHVVSFIGSSNASTGNAGTLFIALKDKPGRKSTADEVIARFVPRSAVYLESACSCNPSRTCAWADARRARNTNTRCKTPPSTSSINGRRACSKSCAACPRSRT